MSQILQDRVAIVTGVHVVVAGLNLKGARQVARATSHKGDRQALGVQVDVTEEAQMDKL